MQVPRRLSKLALAVALLAGLLLVAPASAEVVQYRISGTVTALDGGPVQGANVDAYPEFADPDGVYTPVASAVTNATGAYEIALPAGTYGLTAGVAYVYHYRVYGASAASTSPGHGLFDLSSDKVADFELIPSDLPIVDALVPEVDCARSGTDVSCDFGYDYLWMIGDEDVTANVELRASGGILDSSSHPQGAGSAGAGWAEGGTAWPCGPDGFTGSASDPVSLTMWVDPETGPMARDTESFTIDTRYCRYVRLMGLGNRRVTPRARPEVRAIAVAVEGLQPAGTFKILDGDTVLKKGAARLDGQVGDRHFWLPRLSPGRHQITLRFTPDHPEQMNSKEITRVWRVGRR